MLEIFFCAGYGQGSVHNQLRGPEPHALLAQGGGHGLGGSDQEGNQVNVLEWSSLIILDWFSFNILKLSGF